MNLTPGPVGRASFHLWISVVGMRATGWHNGVEPDLADGYGLRLTKDDRDRHFKPEWDDVVLELEGAEPATVTLMPSFWRTCTELRSAAIGQWFLDAGVAPWAKGNPPGVIVTPLEDNRFAARVLVRKVLRQGL